MRRDMTRVGFGLVIILGALPVLALAQESPTTSGPANPEAISFKVNEKPMEMKLFRADKKLLEQRYAATFRLNMMDWQFRDELDEEIRSRAGIDTQSVLFGFDERVAQRRRSASQFLRDLIQSIPADGRPSEGQLEYFLSEDVDAGYVHIRFIGGGRASEISVRILAPSEDSAKSRSRTLIELLQVEFAVPVKEQLASRQESSLRAAEQQQARINELSGELAQAKKELQEAEDITESELSQLKTQLRLLDVETTGLRARIMAVERLRVSMKGDEPVATKLDDLKITSEVDLAGVSARQERLASIVQRGEQREAINDKLLKIRGDLLQVRRDLSVTNRRLKKVQGAVADARDLLLPPSGEVEITPIEWTE